MPSNTPLILALETSGRIAQIAFVRGGETLIQTTVPGAAAPKTASASGPGRGSSARLIPDIQQLCQTSKHRLQDVDAIAVTLGPGSFTGLRIGIVTAKTLAWALSIPVIGINTLESIAWQMGSHMLDTFESNCVLQAVLNAQRHQLFVQSFRWDGATPIPLDAIKIVDRAGWLHTLPQSSIVGGPALKPLVGELADLPANRNVRIAPAEHWWPSPAAVGRLGALRAARDDFDDPWTLVPNYIRRSYAEE